MPRSVAGRRPGAEALDYESAVSRVMTYGVSETISYRVVDIAGQFGVNAWPVNGGMIVVKAAPGGFTIEENT